jgi:hypothetical protein
MSANPGPRPDRAPESPSSSQQQAALEPLKDADLLQRVEEVRDLMLTRRATELADLVEFLRSKRRLGWMNFLMGLSRGIGFFLGFTIVGAIVVAMVGFFVDLAADTFQTRYDTRTVVRAVVNKYSQVMEEVERVQRERQEGEDFLALPSAVAAQYGALLLREQRARTSPLEAAEGGSDH